VRIAVRQTRAPDAPELELRAFTARTPSSALKDHVVDLVHRMLGLRADLSGFYSIARNDPHVGDLVKRYRGVKPPRFPTLFEAVANAIACQQLTVLVGLTLLNRMARRWGVRLGAREDLIGFPRPQALCGVRPASLRALGFSGQKARTMLELARRCAARDGGFESIAELDNDRAMATLLALHGIGRWSAEYALLRGLGRLDVFPADDVAGRKNLARWLGLRKDPGAERARRLLGRWRPYQGLLYFHFLLANLEARAMLGGAEQG
jgi:DNA-3-methyladenine glycosylase II